MNFQQILGQILWLSLVDRHVVSATFTLVDLAWPNDLVVRVLNELVPVGKPACEPGQREEHSKVLGREPDSLVDDARVEVDIWVQLALDEVLV